jgi:hypothetical protein
VPWDFRLFHQAPEHPIPSNLVENSLRYLQVKVHHQYQWDRTGIYKRHPWQILPPELLVPLILGCALTFSSEAKYEIEAKISFRMEAKKAWFHDSLRCETSKIWSGNKGKISEN